MTFLFNASFAIYLLALVCAAVGLFVSWRGFSTGTTILLWIGAIVNTACIGARWVEAGRAPFSNMYESLVVFALSVVVVHLFTRVRVKIPALGAATSLLALVALAAATSFGAEIQPLMPALQSNWLAFHVLSCMLGYGGFAVSFLAGVAYLAWSMFGKAGAGPEGIRQLELVVAKTVAFGFLFLTIGIITGAVWANSAWGTYWSWDPKETWSFVTWLVYAIFLHCRFVAGWQGRRAVWISVIGFLSVLFTYFGVNFILGGLHSYA